MSYSQNNLRLQSDAPLTGGAQTWVYVSTDTLATVCGASYISNAVDMGMKLGDVVEVHDNSVAATPVVTWCRVVSVGTTSVTLATTQTGTGSGVNEVITNLTTVGAGTILAAAIVGGVLNRTGPTAAAVDTTDTAALIIAAVSGGYVGQSWEFTHYNNSLGACTVTAGTGVTVTGGIVPANMWVRFLVTIATATTVTMTAISAGPCVVLPAAKLTVGTAATVNAGDLEGAYFVNYENNASNAAVTVRTAAQMVAAIPGCQIGFTYMLAIRNLNATGLTLTADGGATVTLSGTMTIAQNVTRLFMVTFPSLTTCTITSMGISAAGA
jgi:hypothetical protein